MKETKMTAKNATEYNAMANLLKSMGFMAGARLTAKVLRKYPVQEFVRIADGPEESVRIELGW